MEEPKNKPWLWICLGLALFIVAMWGIPIPVWWLLGQPQGVGTFGDMFGVVNALFSGLAFAGIIVAIWMQKEELGLQRKEMKESRIAQQGQERALVIAAALNARAALLANSSTLTDPAEFRTGGKPLNWRDSQMEAIELLLQELKPSVPRADQEGES